MRTPPFLLCLAASVLASPAVLGAEQLFDVTGIIRGHLEDGQIVIQHDEIPGYMPAMTMAFTPSNPRDAAQLRNGDRVQFRFRVGEEKSRAESFTVTGHEAPPAEGKNAAKKSSRLRAGDAVPDFELRNEADHPFTATAFRGKATVVTFIFTRCPVPEYCPAMALRFGQIQKAIVADPKLATHARLLSITLDPEFDRPEILKAYGQAVGAIPAVWSFATGAKEAIAALTRTFAVYNERNGVTLDHTLCTALIGTDGRIIEIWRGNDWRVDATLDALTKEAAKIAGAP